MLRKLLALVSLLSIGATAFQVVRAQSQPTAAPTFPQHDPTWQLVFSDEFDGDALDTSRWVTCYWWDDDGCTNAGNQELQWYQPENVLVREGKLHLRAEEERVTGSDGNRYAYTSGMITTGSAVDDPAVPPRFSFRYGYAEIRAKVPRGQGLWPAFWLLPDNQTSKPEIDVLEILGHDPTRLHMALHYLDARGERARSKHEWSGPDFSEGWHTYAVSWTPEALIWYVDDVERWRYVDARYIPDMKLYLLLNLAVGGEWPGAPDATTAFPNDYLIDYVRVWSAE